MVQSVMYTMYFGHSLNMGLSFIVTFIYSLLVHQVLDRVLSDLALVYNMFHSHYSLVV